MSIRNALKREMAKHDGIKIVDVPVHMRPTPESLRLLEREIASQITANDAMRERSFQKASKSY